MTASPPDYLEPVVAWRTWRVGKTPEGSRLQSMTTPAGWPVGAALAAACPHRVVNHTAPWPGCRCGIYGARRVEDAAYYTALPSQSHHTLAIGLVELWGTVVEGGAGWRASRAYPSRLLLLPAAGGRVNDEHLSAAIELADYRVPVQILDGPRAALSDELAQWGLTNGALPAPAPIPA
jgi:hypothetical protein